MRTPTLSPRCLVCDTSLNGVLGATFRLLGIRRSARNPNICTRCDHHIAEGRVVELSVLFADLCGFTTLTNHLGPDRTFQIVDAFLTMASQQVTRHDGFTDKYIGDAIMAFFNVPIRHSDHSRRAIAAALDIQRGLADVIMQEGIELRARVGVAMGYARVGRLGAKSPGDYTVIGDVANLASRLEGLARPGEVLVSARAFQTVAAQYPESHAEQVTAKGFDEPIDVVRLGKGDQVAASRQDPARDELLVARRVGLGSILFTILGMPCAVVTTVGPLAIIVGAGGLLGAVAPLFEFLDQAKIRIPLQALAVLAAAANLYTLWFGRRKRHGLPDTRRERRRVLLVAALSLATILAVVYENYVHIGVLRMSCFSP